MKRQRRSRGFTIIELLIAMGALTLVQAWGVPALVDLVNSVRVNSGAQALSDSLMRARSEALKRNGRVVVCKSSAGQGCEAGTTWEQGWIVFHDANNDAVLDPDESVVYREMALPSPVRLRGNTPVRDYVAYTSVGRTSRTSGAFQAGTFTVCAGQGKRAHARQVVINSVGRARVAHATAAKCS